MPAAGSDARLLNRTLGSPVKPGKTEESPSENEKKGNEMKAVNVMIGLMAMAAAGVASAQVPVYTTTVTVQSAPTVAVAPVAPAAPVYVAPPPVVVYRAAVCVAPPVVVAPQPVYVPSAPVCVVPAPVFRVGIGFGFGHHHHGGGWGFGCWW